MGSSRSHKAQPTAGGVRIGWFILVLLASGKQWAEASSQAVVRKSLFRLLCWNPCAAKSWSP